MAYCRFSSDDFQSDVYVYRADQGYMIHVAGRRAVFKEPLPPKIDFTRENIPAYVRREAQVSELMSRADWVPIELPHAGTDFIEDTAGDAALRLIALRDMGFRVPEYAIQILTEEHEEDGTAD